MKTPFIVSILLFCIALTSCNTSEYMENPQEKIPFEENVPYSFDKITNPAVWAKFNSLKEMQDACQIPENWLKKMSTKNLVETCMNYPLYGLYMAYNNEADGVKVLMSGFNGFKELSDRSDAAPELLNYYEQFTVVDTKSGVKELNEHISPLRLGYIELILASDITSELYNESNCNRLEELYQNTMQSKVQNPDIYSIQSVKKSLLLGSKIKLLKYPLNHNDSVLLRNFIENGGNVSDPNMYSEISNIIIK